MNSTSSAEIDVQPLGCQRDAFELPDDICWLNTSYMSPMLHAVREAANAGVTTRATPWTLTQEDFFDPADQIRRSVADLTSADADGITLVPSVSYAMAIAARNIPVAAGQNVVVVREQFPSNIYPWRRLTDENKATVRTVQFETDDWTESIIASIDGQTAIVSMPHVHWTTGTQFDIVRIAEKVRAVGAALIVDATQSLGTLPFDVSEVQPDFLVASAYKCMLGPYGLTYVYVHPSWRNGVPLEEGWLNRANASDFSQLTEYCDDYMPGARRYDYGERSNSILLAMAIASLKQIQEWTIPRIEATTRPLIEQIVSRADAAGLWHPPLEHCSPCMVGIGLPGEAPNDIGKQLAQRGIYISVRKGNARVAPHIYNNSAEVDRLFDTLQELTSVG